MADFRWTPEPWQADLLDVVRDASQLLQLPPARLDLTLRLLRSSRLLGRVAWRLRAAGQLDALPWVVRDQLESALVVVEARTREIWWELERIALALEDLPDVPVIALKGCAYLLAGTPNAEGRVFSDVDLMVPEADLERVEQQLHRHGWRTAELTAYDDRYYRVWSHEIPPMKHPEREIELDLHHNIVMRTARLKPSPALLLEAARDVPGSRFKVLAPGDMVLHAMVHLFYGGDFVDALRELVDIADLLRDFGDDASSVWDDFRSRARRLDLERPANYAIRFAGEMLDLGLPGVLSLDGWAKPPSLQVRLMAMAVPGTLIPSHPAGTYRSSGWAYRSWLGLRSQLIKMPLPMLAMHLAVKAKKRMAPFVPSRR